MSSAPTLDASPVMPDNSTTPVPNNSLDAQAVKTESTVLLPDLPTSNANTSPVTDPASEAKAEVVSSGSNDASLEAAPAVPASTAPDVPIKWAPPPGAMPSIQAPASPVATSITLDNGVNDSGGGNTTPTPSATPPSTDSHSPSVVPGPALLDKASSLDVSSPSNVITAPPTTTPFIPNPVASNPLFKKAAVVTRQPWFSTTCADLASPSIQVAASATSDASVLTANATVKASLLWDNQSTITYGYLPGASTPGQQLKIDNIISNFISKYVNISLTEIAISSDSTSPAPTIRISCSAGYGSWSHVGQSCKEVPTASATMNLDAISDGTPTTIAETGIILHQLLHALGMTHELPAFIKLSATAATAFYSYSQGWTSDQVTTNILDVYNLCDVSNYTQVDQSSLMMYYMPAQLNMSGQTVPINATPSARDISWLRVNYPRPNDAASLSQDLDVLGVTGDTKTIMLTATLAVVRIQLATWQASQLILSRSVQQPVVATPQAPTVPNSQQSLQKVVPRRAAVEVAAGLNLDPPPVPQPDIKAETGNFLAAIVKSFRQVFNPGGGQFFTLQFPGRFLQMSAYAWDTKAAGVYGQLVKPIAVNESEFRLVDQLYDVADVVAAPNGVSLSQVYEQLLNNLVPISSNTSLAALQDEIRKWLLTEVKASPWIQRLVEAQHADGASSDVSAKVTESGTINRIELSNTLMQDYLTAKQSWETERDQMMQDAMKAVNSADALATLSQKLAHTTATRRAQLAAKYTDAIVRGYTHNVREYISYLDVKTTAETLQDAKDALREAAASSLDGSLKVYPVQLSPIDWFEGLSTSFSPEDLTTNADSLVQQINTKSQQLDVLNQQLIALRLGEKGDVTTLEAQVADAQTAVDTQLTNLSMTYTNNVLAMAKTCLDKQGKLDEDQLTEVATGIGVDPEMIEQLAGDMKNTADAQQALTKASRAYAKALAEYALAQATDSKQQQEQISQQITSLNSEIDVLTSRYQSLNQANQRPAPPPAEPDTALNDIPLMPATNNSAGGSRWQDIVMHHIIQSDYSKQQDRAHGSTTSMTCNLWALSGGGEVTTSGAEAGSLTTKMRNEVWVGFRATLVTVDRGGWFQPQFFKQSAGFYHIARNTFWSRWPSGIASMTDLKNAGDPAFQIINAGLLPAYPQAMIICKDITIKISNDTSTVQTSKVNMQSMASASGGVLCFSFSSSDSSSSSENTYSFKQCTDGCVIRIPGPQVLGYIMQLTENDSTRDLPANLANLFVPPADIQEVQNQPRVAAPRGVLPVVAQGQMFEQIDEILSKTDLPARTVLDIRGAVQKELDTMSADIAARIRTG